MTGSLDTRCTQPHGRWWTVSNKPEQQVVVKLDFDSFTVSTVSCYKLDRTFLIFKNIAPLRRTNSTSHVILYYRSLLLHPTNSAWSLQRSTAGKLPTLNGMAASVSSLGPPSMGPGNSAPTVGFAVSATARPGVYSNREPLSGNTLCHKVHTIGGCGNKSRACLRWG